MKNAPFFVSSILALICVLLSLVSFTGGQTSNSLQSDLLKKQTEIQELSQKFNLQNAEYNRQVQTINTGATVVQRAAPILQNAGYLAAKNKNDKLKTILVRQKLESFIPSDEQLKKIEKQLEEIRAKQGAGAPVEPSAPVPTPAP
jgi:hypothetical protein